MFQEFKILTIDTDMKSKSITITTNYDIDPESINDSNIQLYEKKSRNELELELIHLGKDIKIVLDEWPIPNTEYIFRVQKLKNVLDEPLAAGIRRKIIFKSKILSDIRITYPASNEVIKDLKVVWEEDNKLEKDVVKSYYLEISTDNAFHKVIKKINVENRNEVDLTEIINGQYYIRGRVEGTLDGEWSYGTWSETITFQVGNEAEEPDDVYDPNEDDEEPIYSPDINIVTQPLNGNTPKSIILEFDCNIDPDSVKEILLLRRNL